jgi:hypothetical protein
MFALPHTFIWPPCPHDHFLTEKEKFIYLPTYVLTYTHACMPHAYIIHTHTHTHKHTLNLYVCMYIHVYIHT